MVPIIRLCLILTAFSYQYYVISYNLPTNYGAPPPAPPTNYGAPPPAAPIVGNYGSASAAVIAHNPVAKPTNHDANIERVVNNITKPSSENERSYRGLVLKNGMKVVLVSDPNSNHSAAHLIVSSVGGMKDPRDSFGMAHFIEHMLFQGSVKYPVKDQFWNFVDNNGGYKNAQTGDDMTGYFFAIPHNNFNYALDM